MPNRKRTLNSDELGEHGEDLFKASCSELGLVCNQVKRDRRGWDAVIEFDFDNTATTVSFDQRPPAVTCFIQVKTTWADTKKIQLRLSTLEHLAKKTAPALVIVQKLNSDRSLHSRTIIHLLGAPLAKVLERLRQAASEKTKLQSEWVYWTAEKLGRNVSPLAESLKAEIIRSLGDETTMHDYVRKKEHQLKTLGYEEYAVRGRLRFDGLKIADFVDGALGLRPLAVQSFEAEDVRFGIPLPLFASEGPATIQLTPTNPTACKLSARQSGSIDVAFLPGEFLVPAFPLPSEHFKAVVRTRFMDISYTRDGVNWKADAEHLSSLKATANEWANFYKLTRIVSGANARLKLEVPNLPALDVPVTNVTTTIDHRHASSLEKISINAIRVLDAVGAPDLMFDFTELTESASDIDTCLALMDGDVKGEFFSAEVEIDDEHPRLERRFGVALLLPFLNQVVCCYVITEAEFTTSARSVRIGLRLPEFCEITILKDTDVQPYLERTAKSYQLRNYASFPTQRLKAFEF